MGGVFEDENGSDDWIHAELLGDDTVLRSKRVDESERSDDQDASSPGSPNPD